MKTLLCVLILLFAVILFIFIDSPETVQSAEFSNEDSKSKEYLKEMKKSENEVDENKNFKFYENKDEICKNSVKKYDDLMKTISNYMQRYVSLFLITSNLRDYKIKDINENILVDLEITITGEDLQYLQGYSHRVKDSSHSSYKDFSKLDAIFSKIARVKEKSFAENALKFSFSFFTNSNMFCIISNPSFQLLLIVTSLAWAIHRKFFRGVYSFKVFLTLTINILLLWESFSVYWEKVKETDAEIIYNTMFGLPQDCDPANYKWYHSLRNYFVGDPCLQYYKNLNKNALNIVSLFKCIFDTYAFYIIQTPMRLFGASIRDCIQEISSLWPVYLRVFINISLVPFFAILLVFFIVILILRRFKLYFFGVTLEVGGAQMITKTEKPAPISYEEPTTKRLGILKPWTKSRFPRILNGNIRKRKKVFLMPFKSDCTLPSKEEQNVIDSSENLINNDVKHD